MAEEETATILEGAEATGEGEGTSWRDGLPDDLKASKSLEKFGDVSALAKSYLEQESFAGGAVRVPGENASQEDLDKFYAKIRPETPEGYEIPKPDLPEGIDHDEEFQKEFLAMAHGVGLSKRQAQGIAEWWNQKQLSAIETHANESAEVETQLKKEFGSEYTAKLAHAHRVVNQFFDKDTVAVFTKTALGNHPGILRGLAAIGERVGEKAVVTGEGALGGESSSATQSKINEIMADTNHPYHKGNKEAVEEVRQLYVNLHAAQEAEKAAGA